MMDVSENIDFDEDFPMINRSDRVISLMATRGIGFRIMIWSVNEWEIILNMYDPPLSIDTSIDNSFLLMFNQK